MRSSADGVRASAERTAELRRRHSSLYSGLWRHHLAEVWADVPVDEVTPAAIRSWHAKAGRTTGPTALAQAYRLLRAILNVAVADEVIQSNPCRLRGAGTPKASRPLPRAYRDRGRAVGRATGSGPEDRAHARLRLPSWPCRFDPGHPLHASARSGDLSGLLEEFRRTR
jgi:hypothetical protein